MSSENFRYYEMVLIIDLALDDESAKELVNGFAEMITKENGEVFLADLWCKRKLCYEVKKAKKAHYAIMQFKTEFPALKELERKLKLNESILRFMTLVIKPDMLIKDGKVDSIQIVEERRYNNSEGRG